MYRVNEIFYSLQGEGAYTGTPMVFVRFSGCNRSCNFCDTDFEEFTPLSSAEIVDEAQRYPARTVVLTGGEPTLQADAELIEALHEAGFRIHIETNGSLPVPEGIDWVTCSPKDGKLNIQPEAVDEIKIVFTGQSAEALEAFRLRFPTTQLFYLQPCSGLNIDDTVARVLSLRGWRLSLQTHRLINIK